MVDREILFSGFFFVLEGVDVFGVIENFLDVEEGDMFFFLKLYMIEENFRYIVIYILLCLK